MKPSLAISLLLTILSANADIQQQQQQKQDGQSKDEPLTTDEIPTFHSKDASAASSDFANYFSAYAQLYHQKQMLTDQNRMAAYHAAIVGNKDIFRDKVSYFCWMGSFLFFQVKLVGSVSFASCFVLRI